MKSIKTIDLKGKKVLIRVDFNVPVENDEVTDNTRIKNALPTILHILDNGGAVILMTHFGRPKGKVIDEFRVHLIASTLENLLKIKIKKIDDCIGKEKDRDVKKLKPGEILLLENTRLF